MDRNENRAVIKYFWLKGLKPIDIFEEMRKVLGEEMAPSWTTVKNWVGEFKRGRLSVEDVKRAGRPKEVTTFENISKVQELVEKDKQIKVADIAKTVGLSKERAFNILVKELCMRKLANGWERIPQLDENDDESDNAADKEAEVDNVTDKAIKRELESADDEFSTKRVKSEGPNVVKN